MLSHTLLLALVASGLTIAPASAAKKKPKPPKVNVAITRTVTSTLPRPTVTVNTNRPVVSITVPGAADTTVTVNGGISTSTTVRTTNTVTTTTTVSEPTHWNTEYAHTTYIPTGIPALARRSAIPLPLGRRAAAPATYPAYYAKLTKNVNNAGAVSKWISSYTSTCTSQCKKGGSNAVINYAKANGPPTYLVACICANGDIRSKPAFSMNDDGNGPVGAQIGDRVIIGQPATTPAATSTVTVTVLNTPVPSTVTVATGNAATLTSTLPPSRTSTVTSFSSTSISTSLVVTTDTSTSTVPGTQTRTSTTTLALPTQTVRTTNLLVNGDFEDYTGSNPNNWTPSASGQWHDDAGARSGYSCAAANLVTNPSLRQSVTVINGAQYKAGCYVYSPSSATYYLNVDANNFVPGSAGSSWQLLQGTYTGSTDGPIDFMFGYVGTVSAVYMNDDCFFVRVGTN